MLSLQVSTTATPYQNDDILPLPLRRRTWTKRTFIYFWLSISISLGAWSGASTSLAAGLTVGQAIAVCAISNVVIVLGMVASGQAGSTWHIPFAVINRTCWGIRGSWFVVTNRVILSCCWFGVDAWYGGQMVKVMIGAIWPSFYGMENTFSEKAAMKTNSFISFVIFLGFVVPLILVRPERYRLPCLIASMLVTIAAFAVFIWALVKQGNVGPLWNKPDDSFDVEVSKSDISWTMMWMTTRGVGTWASGILYQSDFTRYAKRPNDQIWGQIFVVPLSFFFANILGIITTSCARGLYPDEPLLWKVSDLLHAIQVHEGRSARPAVFFAGLAFFLSLLSSTVAASAIVGGIDLSAMLPRYIDIRRGAYIILIVGIAIQPWKILNTPNNFIDALSGYAVFLGPLTGIMLTEYHVLRRQRIKLSHLFIPNSTSDYWFWRGINWRAPIAWLLGVFPNLPGFAASISAKPLKVNMTWMHVFYMSWFLGFLISGMAWIILNLLWPPPGQQEVDEEDIFDIYSDKDEERKEFPENAQAVDKGDHIVIS
ncbi:hypothetical protein AGABI2DRAFT_181761 [Agaricus bisporus var. bisporus H97]|uniref:hypothetical protein n=1 Tax=Agaricus bisporus var. bisporus (strain H97 / ATCC MYA-4626 / FGSC 10389) TaxID=936046 RepID=UPI00029F5507|nr:hypothetical protein AGABI2DRAFT_181761 [Agaricus bisporus var. bisporus H97]EKV41751.1 hypothetical protein AGABI2DRAFT_181761 [Agaricus bisporus var. bisporus H97]